jgi:hypothetical protein
MTICLEQCAWGTLNASLSARSRREQQLAHDPLINDAALDQADRAQDLLLGTAPRSQLRSRRSRTSTSHLSAALSQLVTSLQGPKNSQVAFTETDLNQQSRFFWPSARRSAPSSTKIDCTEPDLDSDERGRATHGGGMKTAPPVGGGGRDSTPRPWTSRK